MPNKTNRPTTSNLKPTLKFKYNIDEIRANLNTFQIMA